MTNIEPTPVPIETVTTVPVVTGTVSGGTAVVNAPVVKTVNWVQEASLMFERAVYAAIGSFTGAVTVLTFNDNKALEAAGVGAGLSALSSIASSLRQYIGS